MVAMNAGLKKSIILFTMLAAAAVVYFLLIPPRSSPVIILHPFEGAVFPADMASPEFRWQDDAAQSWTLVFDFADNNEELRFTSYETEWKPERPVWETIKRRSLEGKTFVTIRGTGRRMGLKTGVSKGTVTFSTSPDSVKAPVFFRAVTLPFEFAVHNMETIKWCLGDVSSDQPPRIVLEEMPVCCNCHSFTRDGRHLGMDVDYANDKGSYIVTAVGEEIILSNEKVITWSDYRREDGELTFGLLSQISPDGRYAVSTVKDRSVFVPKDDPYFSQLFFPIKGILAFYDTETGRYSALPGADDRAYVQSNPSWSPDGQTLIFAKSEVGELADVGEKVLLSQEDCREYLSGEKEFKFDLCRIPFRGGRGGVAQPIEGASDNGKSNYFAKYSPDGRWIVFCQANSYMLLQPDSRLFIMPAAGGAPREMTCNTDSMNSWHSWSPNSRWMVFSSKAFSPYTQLFITHIDENGMDSPPVLLANFSLPDRAVNIPEFVNIAPHEMVCMRQDYIDYYSYHRRGVLEFQHDDQKAEQLLREALKLDPKHADSHQILGSLLLRKQRLEEAEQEYQTALRLDPKDAANHINMGNLHLLRKEYGPAQQAFERAVQIDAKAAYAYEGLGAVSFARGDLVRAQANYRKAIELDPGYPPALTGLGEILLMKGELGEARDLFDRALQLDPGNPGAHNNLGTIHWMQGDAENAEREYRLALNFDEQDPSIHHNLGALFLNQRDYVRAQAAFENALKADPEYAAAHEGLGVLFLSTGQIDRARESFRTALDRNPGLVDARYRLGTIYLEEEKWSDACREFESALKVNPDHYSALYGLGVASFRNKEYGQAQRAFRSALNLKPGDADASLWLGRVLALSTNRVREAIALYLIVIRQQPAARTCVELGNLYLRVGERDKAIEEFENALRLEPGQADLKEYITRLKQES